MSDNQDTKPLVELFKVGDKVYVAGQGEATVHQVFGDGAVLEVAVLTVKYVTVSKDIVSRGN